MTTVLVLSVGPVRDFISAGRKVRDLWAGSRILSELAYAAAQGAADVVDRKNLVFPPPLLLEDETDEDATAGDATAGIATAGIANKVLLVVPSGKAPREVAESAVKAARARLDELAELSFRGLGGHFQRESAVAQVRDAMEFSWAAASGQDYQEARLAAEDLLSARKATRVWSQPSWGGPVPKSSIDGARESVLHEDLFAGGNPLSYGVGKAERLCGISLLKRRFRGDVRFESTADVAVSSFVAGLASRGNWDALVAVTGPANAAEALFERFDDVRDIEAAKAAAARVLAGARPDPHYALIVADGDRMGKTIDDLKTFEAHQALSEAAARFSGVAARLVEDAGGLPVYAGGDDLFALAPVSAVFGILKGLKDEFHNHFSGYRQLTLSAGVIVCHHRESLREAREWARAAEGQAKESRTETSGGLCFEVHKRSGAPHAASGAWDEVLNAIESMTNWREDGRLSGKTAYELQRVARLSGEGMAGVVAAETRRVLARKRMAGGAAPVGQADAQALGGWALKDPAGTAERLLVARAFVGRD